ncbi:MAG: hypothetical protein KF791_06880 [Verrucomicrobiae bacterium]|nr:hypothetical protein [Verrucomicrobiae bacterium]
MPKRDGFDWVAFAVHFLFGAILGAGIGMTVWGRPALGMYESRRAGAVCIALGALSGGLLAGFGRDSFWSSLGR